jgi:hypothetical protein
VGNFEEKFRLRNTRISPAATFFEQFGDIFVMGKKELLKLSKNLLK